MNTFVIFLGLGLIFALLFRHLKNGAVRSEASYMLYSVRDELVCLVAEEKLDENSRIFQYYYKRVNILLENAPNVGVDDALDAFLYLHNSKGFEHSLAEAKRRAHEMLNLVEDESNEVSEVIANYYSASKCMMLAHSSLLRMLYIAAVKWPVAKAVNSLLPKDTYAALKTVNFAANEANQFRHMTHNHTA